MPIDYIIESSGDSQESIPHVQSTVDYLLENNLEFKISYNHTADSCSIKFKKPMTDFRISQMLTVMGWVGTPLRYDLKNLQKYRPTYHSPLYPDADDSRNWLVNTGDEMTPAPAFEPIKTVSD